MGLQLAANTTELCILSLIALLQCLESLESGQCGTQWSMLTRGACENIAITERNNSDPRKQVNPQRWSPSTQVWVISLYCTRMLHTHRIILCRVVGEPLFDFGDNLDDFNIRNVFARHEHDTLEQLRSFFLDRFLGCSVKLGWTRHMQFFDTLGLECFSAEWACTRREVPKTSEYRT